MSRSPGMAKGVTLLEVMLVIAIATSMMLLSVRVYQTLQAQSDVTKLRYNVDEMFVAAAQYYQANCRPQRDPITGDAVAGTGGLAPTDTYDPPNPYPVTVSQLASEGFLDRSLPRNPIVNNSGSTMNGYVVQFNLVTPETERKMTTDTAPFTELNVGKIILWRIQVAVKLAKPSMANTYKQMLNADCVSQLIGNSVRPCNTPAAPGSTGGGDYLVWERLPSFASPDANPSYMTTNATNKQFMQLYDTVSPQLSSALEPANRQNYLCGS